MSPSEVEQRVLLLHGRYQVRKIWIKRVCGNSLDRTVEVALQRLLDEGKIEIVGYTPDGEPKYRTKQ